MKEAEGGSDEIAKEKPSGAAVEDLDGAKLGYSSGGGRRGEKEGAFAWEVDEEAE